MSAWCVASPEHQGVDDVRMSLEGVASLLKLHSTVLEGMRVGHEQSEVPYAAPSSKLLGKDRPSALGIGCST